MKYNFTRVIILLILGITSVYPALSQTNQNVIQVMNFGQPDYDVLSNNNLFGQIDFYNSTDITLYRELSSNETMAANGILKIINDKRYEYITLNKYTIGRYYSTTGYTDLRISFDANFPEKSLQFDLRQSTNGSQLFFLTTTIINNNQVAVNYDNNVYNILVGTGNRFDRFKS